MKEYTGRFISVLYRKGQIYWTQELKKRGISSAEYPILLRLYQNDGITQDDIANELCLDKSAVTRAIQSLTEKGLIEKRKDDWDRRFNQIYLTQKGREREDGIEQVRKGWNEVMLGGMDAGERAELNRLLAAAVRNVTKKPGKVPDIEMKD